MWHIVVMTKNERDVTRIADEEAANAFYNEVKENFKDSKGVEVYKVSAKYTIPIDEDRPKPKRKKSERGPLLWCPYCGDWRSFHSDRNSNYACPVCTISVHDFYVKKYNHLWDSKVL